MNPRVLSILCLLAISLVAGACRSDKGAGDSASAVNAGRLVLKRGEVFGRDASVGAPDQWFDEQLRVVEKEIAAGEFEAAIRRVHGIRERNPGPIVRAQLDQMLQRANLAVLELPTLRGEFEAIEDPISFGSSVRVRVRFTNLGRRPIRIPVRFEGTSDSMIEIDLVRREWNTRAQVVTSSRIVRLPLEHDWDIPVGGSAEQILDLGVFGNDKGLNGFRVYAVSGRLRPARLEMGALRRWESIPIRATFVRSFRPNWEHLADDPLKRVEQAIEKSASTHLMTAAALLAPDERQEAVDVLVEQLRGDRVIDWAIFASLEYVTRVELGRDANAWKAWWGRVRDTYFKQDRVVPPDSKEPRFEVGR